MLEENPLPPEQPAADDVPAPAAAPPKRRTHPLLRVFAVLLAMVAAIIVGTLTIDLGPSLRKRAETAASKYIDRPMHIGTLKVLLLSGTFELDDVRIDGLRPEDRPFLTARRIYVNLPWWSIFNGELIVSDVDMSDWNMLIETFPDGRHNFPRFGGPPRDKSKPAGPKRFTTTVSSVIARRGQFTYQDHGTPWSVVCRNLTVNVFKGLEAYHGTAQFSNGTVAIQSYDPFRADMQTRFKIDGSRIILDGINLQSTGASTAVTGYVDLSRWPEMFYKVKSRVDFPTQKHIFFKDLNFTTTGHADFDGYFHIFKGGRELKGSFASPEAGVNAWRFPDVHGNILWVPDRFEVTDVTSALYGGHGRYSYRLAPLGQRGRPTIATWDTQYTDVDLTRLTDFLQLEGIRLSGRATGKNHLEWPLGKWSDKRGSGQIAASMPAGIVPMTRQIDPAQIAHVDPLPPLQGPFNAHLEIGHVPVAGTIDYVIEPGWINVGAGSWAATEDTFVAFNGRTAWGQNAAMPFHVTSLDWQESDRVLAGIMTAFGAPTGAIPIGGRGMFDGTMTGAFTDPRIEGHFEGERMRAWDVVWGATSADLLIQNAYVFISRSRIRQGDSEINAEGRFSLGYPRKDHGEEINATVRMSRRPLADLRHAFDLDDYRVDGVASGEYRLTGAYTTPDGYGRLEIDHGSAYGETFDSATADLRFETGDTPGVRLENILMVKSSGRLTGAAFVGWDGTYSFDATGQRIAVESLATLSFPRAPLSGVLQLSATGAGTFDSPRYDVRLQVADLFAGDEGIGQLRGRLSMRNDMLTMELDAESPRLSVTGSGRVALTPEMDAELTLNFSDTSLDPYLRFFEPRLSPFTTAVAGGTVHVSGELSDIDHLIVDTSIDSLNLKLFDYSVHNAGPLKFALDRHRVEVQQFKLEGDGTSLSLDGEIALHDDRIALTASGDANLSILQGFFRDLRSSGSASLRASIEGPLEAPVFSGNANVSDGRIRFTALPHSLQNINGHVSFDAQGIRVDSVTAELGGGRVQFGGRIGIQGFTLSTFDLTATGERMNLRYPEGFRSVADASLALRGPIDAPVLSGAVTLHQGVYESKFDPTTDILSLASNATTLPRAATTETTIPLRYDIQVEAPSGSLMIRNTLAQITASANLTLSGTYDKPQLFGRADIDRGEVFFEGNRFVVTRGTVDFYNPAAIEPFFDVEAETRVHVPSVDETYRITLAISGTLGGHLNFSANSDPPLTPVDILSVLFGQSTDVSNPELRALNQRDVTQSEEQLLRAGLLQVLAGPLAAPVTRAVEQTFGINTVQLAPSLGTQTDPLTPTARLIIGKRLSDRAYLTFSRALGTTQREQIIVLEYDQSDRLGWILTQTGDRTFSIDFRVRRSF
ncbi:MAG TPA: translocation/assembly module TamB domain-containing protein [Vicinamibacterales bacterium]|nr:translocation/assembly module TamB domain-containing protein [Vicinamibacterales bacterium]